VADLPVDAIFNANSSDATMRPTPQDNQLMSKHRVLGFKPQLRLEWRGQHGQSETKSPIIRTV
jgi:hypothetical protein